MEYHSITEVKKLKKKNDLNIHKIKSTNSSQKKLKKSAKKLKHSSRQWLERHINDPFVQQAKKDDLISRAAYKIIEINNKFHFLKTPSIVIDIGSAPGGWTKAVWSRIQSRKSQIISIDLLEMDESIKMQPFSNNIHIIQGDFTSPEITNEIENILTKKKANVIMSDMAHSATGSSIPDHLAIYSLVREVIDFTYNNIAEDGVLIFKIFEGEEVKNLVTELRRNFEKVKIFKPSVSRQKSPEIYIISLGYKKLSNCKDIHNLV